MAIQSVMSAGAVSAPDSQSKFKEVSDAFQALGSALQSGDLKAAQSAFDTIQKNAPSGQLSGTPQSGSSMSSDLSALSSALQSGDLKAAQQAFGAIQQHMHSHKHHGGSHSHSESSASATDADSASTFSVTA